MKIKETDTHLWSCQTPGHKHEEINRCKNICNELEWIKRYR